MLRVPVIHLRGLSLVLSGLLIIHLSGCLTQPQPAATDPGHPDFLYLASDQRKAPHTLVYDGGLLEAWSTQGPFLLPTTSLTVEAGPHPGGVLGGPDLSRGRATYAIGLSSVNGTLATDEGEVQLTGRDVLITATSHFEFAGQMRIAAQTLVARGDRLWLEQGPGEPGLPAGSVDVPPEIAADERIHVGTAVRVAERDGRAELGQGFLTLYPGKYEVYHGFLSWRPDRPVRTDAPGLFGASTAPHLQLNGETLQTTTWSASVLAGTVELDLANGSARINATVDQVSDRGWPLLEARVTMSFHPSTDAIELAHGETTVVWLRVAETGGVGRASDVFISIESPTILVALGPSWVTVPNREDERAATSLGRQASFGPVMLLREGVGPTDIPPSSNRFVALALEVPKGLEPGSYGLTLRASTGPVDVEPLVLAVHVP